MQFNLRGDKMKNQAKRSISLFLTVIMVLSIALAFGITASGENENQATITVGNEWGTPGSTVTVDVVISENPGILAAMLTVSWDENLTLVDDKSGEAFSYMTYTAPSRYKANGTNFTWYANDVGEVVDGTILTLTFMIPESANGDEEFSIDVSYVQGDVFDGNADPVMLNITNGYVRVVTYIPGDSTGDSKLNMLDVVSLSRYISDGCVTDPDGYNVFVLADACDITGDGRINMLDVVGLSRYISDGCVTDSDGYNVVLKPGDVHDETVDEAVAPTCTETGLTEGKHCSVCNKVFVAQTIVDALGHTETVDEAVEPTCTETGLTEGKHCSVCDEILVAQIIVDALGHTETVDEAVAPTCTETGLTEGKHCSVCDEILVAQAIVDAFGHTEVVDDAVEPTCTETGLTEGKHCSVCNKVLVAQTVVDALGHTEVIDSAVEPTCTETGLTEGNHCSICGEVIVEQETVSALGHSFGDWITVKQPTFAEEGLKERTCACGEKETEVVEIIYSEGLRFTLNNDKASYSVYGIGTCKDTDIVIPSTYNGLPVTSLPLWVFEDCYITSITIPYSVTSVASDIYFDCDNLKSIVVDSNNEHYMTIDDNLYSKNGEVLIVYAGGKKDTSFTIPDGVTRIGGGAFSRCGSLTSIIIPDGVTSIGIGAFYCCRNLTSIIVPNSVTEIDVFAFQACGALSGITFDGTVDEWREISKSCWDYTGEIYCTDGEIAKDGTVTMYECIPPAIKHTEVIDPAVAPTCTETGLTEGKHCSICGEVIVEQETVSAFGHSFGEWVIIKEASITEDGLKERVCYCGEKETEVLFKGLKFALNSDGESYSVTGIGACANTNIVIPSIYNGLPVTRIGRSAFSGCDSITSITIPDSVTSIGDYAFCECTSLSSIVLPKGITAIGSGMFEMCYSLDNVIIPNGVTSIGDWAFSNCTSLDSIIIPDSVTSIGDYAFYNCTSLESIMIPDSVTSIGEGLFYDCLCLASVIIPDSVTSIGSSAFFNCESLDNIIFGGSKEEWDSIVKGSEWDSFIMGPDWEYNTLEYIVYFDETVGLQNDGLQFALNDDGESYLVIGVDAFTYTKINIPSMYNGLPVINIGDDAFSWCEGIKQVVILDGITSIGYRAFYHCSNLSSIIIPDSVTSIGENSFSWCLSFTSITIPDSVASIGDYAFCNCDGLRSITIPDSVTSIGDSAFSYCYSLTSVTIGSGVTSIGNRAFFYCQKLTSIMFEGTIDEWNEIDKGDYWNSYTGEYTIYCTDGKISKSGRVTYY